MIKIKKLGLILEELVYIDSVLKNGMVIRIPCKFVEADYDRLYLRFPLDKKSFAQYFYEGKVINVTLDTLEGRRIYPAMVLYEPQPDLLVVEYYNEKGVNQRQHFRVKATKLLDVEINGIMVHSVTIDISTGGFRILLSDELKEGEIYRAVLMMHSKEPPIDLTFKVKNVFFVSSEKQYEISGEFNSISDNDIKRITKFCFDMQTKFINNQSYYI